MNKGKIFTNNKQSGNNKPISQNDNNKLIKQPIVHEDTDDEENDTKERKHPIYDATYEEIYNFLSSILSNNKHDLKEVLKLARSMVKEGVRTSDLKSLVNNHKTIAYNINNKPQNRSK